MTKRIAAGLECRRDVGATDIVELVHKATARAGVAATLLAAPALKRDEPGLHAAAAALGLQLVFVDEVALAAVQARLRSSAGPASLAERCALAVFGEAARLILPRLVLGRATCALAEGAA